MAGASAKHQKRGAKISGHVLVDAEWACWQGVPICASADWSEGWDLQKPCILSQSGGIFEDGVVSAALKDFHGLFRESSMRVTEGRALAPLNANAAEAVITAVHGLCKKASANLVLKLSPELSRESPDLSRLMTCSSFGLAANHVSIGKFELNQFPCLRASWQGTRFVSVVLLSTVRNLLQREQSGNTQPLSLQRVQDRLFQCTQADVQKFCAEGGAFAATVGPNDVLYVPAGSMVSHRVHGSDVYGVRVGVLSPPMQRALSDVLGVVPDNKAVDQARKLLADLRVERAPQGHAEKPAWQEPIAGKPTEQSDQVSQEPAVSAASKPAEQSDQVSKELAVSAAGKPAEQSVQVSREPAVSGKLAEQSHQVSKELAVSGKPAEQSNQVSKELAVSGKLAEQSVQVSKELAVSGKLAEQSHQVSKELAVSGKPAEQSDQVSKELAVSGKLAEQSVQVSKELAVSGKPAEQSVQVSREPAVSGKPAEQSVQVSKEPAVSGKPAEQSNQVSQNPAVSGKPAEQSVQVPPPTK